MAHEIEVLGPAGHPDLNWDEFYSKDATDAWFKQHYEDAYRRSDWYTLACTLSGRLRQMDKRAKLANRRAEAAEHELRELKAQKES